MVAAWMRAETGVGPSMASGSQVWNGTWADFANAPTRSRMHPATRSPSLGGNAAWTCLKVSRKSSEPEPRNTMKYVPSTRPTSPITLMTKALIPARVAVVRRNQKLMSMYDAAPTKAQPMMSGTKFPAITSNSIEKTKKFR